MVILIASFNQCICFLFYSPAKEVGGITWAPNEMSCLFDGMTAIPFDDLDSIDEHGLVLGGEQGYPLPLVHRFGSPDRYVDFPPLHHCCIANEYPCNTDISVEHLLMLLHHFMFFTTVQPQLNC